jgi:3-methylfumaryl-CoA hydratase
MIFRLSAVRFNSHRIHYDRDYTTRVEGYPGLVVPVTLITFLMMEMCRAQAPERPLASFSYRSIKPVIDLGPYTILGAPDENAVTLWATDHEAALAVTAEARLTG